ncbi:probable LRR receptor-like serine/threonine-protein kinase At3g47570 [Prosopis cineraria]|uniref:probable LRR receptor-like serine/threonine-protein kinase At3g47570 n=1 Tax=Prosopis cineraria TaxID=364024 RepID=UPI00240F9490|nr:probable LRR receptor-like serine/threonine-protein kinase At3g47570 [Prosopis cineraria]
MAFASLSQFCSIYLQAIISLCVNLIWLQNISAASASGNETDYMALLKFKESIANDPFEALSSWNSSSHLCNWHGITCSQKHQRVIELRLPGYHLRGVLSPHVGNLSFLRNLYLPNNSFYGEIPPELGHLFRLQKLSLRNNMLTGEIPLSLTNCTELQHVNLSSNSLTGKIPFEIGSLRKLEKLNLFTNNLTGEIPASMWNLSSLNVLSVAFNNLEGIIPEEIGHLKSLSVLSIVENKFFGMLPYSFYNMSSLTFISAANNQLSRTKLPDNMFTTLPNLQSFGIGGNQISSSIPTSITNATFLQLFDIGVNNFFGEVPSLGSLKDLQWLNLNYNNLGNSSNHDLDFISSLENCTKLENLILSTNRFGGLLPDSISNLSTQLIRLYLGDNQIYGTIPETLGRYTNLIALVLEYNQFTGSIPASFGKFHELQILGLGRNQLSGEIPASLANLSQLVQLSFSQNMLEGKIPPVIESWQNIVFLDLSENNLSGAIPLQVFSLFSLSTLLNLSHNSLNGSLPIEVGKLKNIGTFDISENYLSGEIPRTIGDCTSLEYLSLQGNSFNGSMPPSLASLKGLKYLDLSHNNLSGSIPKGLQNISILEYLNVSFNALDGEVPTDGVFKNASAIFVAGNYKLCGGIYELHLPPCPFNIRTKSKHLHLKLLVIIICVAVCLVLASISAIYWWRKRNRILSSTSQPIDQLSKLSYQRLHSATEGFSSKNLIGYGSSGFVYKGMLQSEDKVVAIKVLNLQKKGAHKSFISECNALKNIRHRNLVKVLTCCSSLDYKGQEFKALVFEYMSNGSLEEWLHPSPGSIDQTRTLNFTKRLSILNDVACALHYLHYECEKTIVHCDLKPSNILLDDDMVAHVSDFGLARLLSILSGSSQKQSSTVGIKGTIGYAPPEYGMGSEVSTQGDVYSFGILVLEMLTGKRPTEEMFKDGHNLHNYAKTAYPDNIVDIVDSALLSKEIKQTATARSEKINMENQTLISLFSIGLACSEETPKERANMMNTTRRLNLITTAFCGHGN